VARQHNLYEPVNSDGGDHGAHGSFDSLAHDFSLQLWMTTHRGAVALALVALLMLFGVMLAAR